MTVDYLTDTSARYFNWGLRVAKTEVTQGFFPCPAQSLVKNPNALIHVSLIMKKIMIKNQAAGMLDSQERKNSAKSLLILIFFELCESHCRDSNP